MRYLNTILCLLLLVSILACDKKDKKSEIPQTRKEALSFEGSRLDVQKITINGDTLLVEIAVKTEDREKGLMQRQYLPDNAGMLFVFEYSHTLSFWMKNTEIPLSIAYIDENWKIVDIQKMKPLDENSYESKFPAKYALEVNQGWFENHNVKVGDKIDFIGE